MIATSYPQSMFPPYGSALTLTHSLVDDPSEQRVLEVLRSCVARRLSPEDIVSELNGRGYRTRSGSEWRLADVLAILPTARIDPSRSAL